LNKGLSEGEIIMKQFTLKYPRKQLIWRGDNHQTNVYFEVSQETTYLKGR